MNHDIPQVNRLLILSCSNKKTASPDWTEALDRYDGPAFRVIRRFIRENRSSNDQHVDIYILSARFGLLNATTPIPNYDLKMTPELAAALCPQVSSGLELIISSKPYKELFVYAGANYLIAMEALLQRLKNQVAITRSKGLPGQRLVMLRDWLWHGKAHNDVECKVCRNETTILRGHCLALSSEEVLIRARKALKLGRGNPKQYSSWYVMVDDQPVGAKWLVSELTDLPVGSFTSSEAKRVLKRLGIEIRRV